MHLVVVPIDYTENSRVLIDELREKLKKVNRCKPSKPELNAKCKGESNE